MFSFPQIALVLLALSVAGYYAGQRRSLRVASQAGGLQSLHSLPGYYGCYAALWTAVPALLLLLAWLLCRDTLLTRAVILLLPPEARGLPAPQLNLLMNDVRNLAQGNMVSGAVTPALQAAADHYQRFGRLAQQVLLLAVVALALGGAVLARSRISPALRARNRVEAAARAVMIGFASIAILTTVGIVLSVVYESWLFFRQVPAGEFFLGTVWSPQTALRADQVAAAGSFGAIPLFTGTLMVSAIALLVAVPIGLMSAIYLSEYASRRTRSVAKPLLEMLAGIPTVVYGFFAALTMAPLLRSLGESMGLTVASESALAAGLVMGVMIIPFVSSLSDDVINAVPQDLRNGSYALGATRSETVTRVVLRAALPGIVGGVLLAVSRAIGETMIVVMAAGLSANLTANPLDSVTTVTVQIVTLLTGDQEFDSAKTLAAFALGLTLFVFTLGLNLIALHTVRKYREHYE